MCQSNYDSVVQLLIKRHKRVQDLSVALDMRQLIVSWLKKKLNGYCFNKQLMQKCQTFLSQFVTLLLIFFYH